jgi:hypothetical protein
MTEGEGMNNAPESQPLWGIYPHITLRRDHIHLTPHICRLSSRIEEHPTRYLYT